MKRLYITSITFVTALIVFMSATTITNAQQTPQNMPDNSNVEYTLLEPLPDLQSGSNTTVSNIKFRDYVQYTFNLFIAISAAAAVLMIVYGGFLYMTTDSWQGKSEGINKVKNAIYGLLLVLGSYLLLRTVDPRLVEIPSTLVKPLKIKYDPMLKAFDDYYFDQINAEMALYHTNMDERRNNVASAKERIQSATTQIEQIKQQIKDLVGEDGLSDEDLSDVCASYTYGTIAELCVEWGEDEILIADASFDIEVEFSKAKYDQRVFVTGPSQGSRVSKFKQSVEELNREYATEYQKLKSAGASPQQLKQLEYYKNYTEAMIKLNEITAPINDIHSKYLKEQTAVSRSIGNAGDAVNNMVGFEVSNISPLDWLTTSQTEYWNKLSAAQNTFMTESLKIKNEYRSKMDPDTFNKFTAQYLAQSKMIMAQKVITQ